MQSRTHLVSRATRTLTAVLMSLTGALAAISLTAAPAQAEYDVSQKWGYAKIAEPQMYLRHYVHWKIEVLHVDEEHMDADGFWFAHRGISDRGFEWRYQPFGAWCDDTLLTIQWNPWLNTHQCGVDPAAVEAEQPGTAAATALCRETTGHPWKTGYWNTSYCGDGKLVAYFVQQEPGQPEVCAPWEDQGKTAAGKAKCLQQRYAWEADPHNSYWSPAPDTCTGMPADSNIRYRDPALYVPAEPRPGCTGEEPAPNCTPGNQHRACTGVPRTFQYATASASVTVTDGVGSATVTRSAKRTAVAYQVTRTAKATYKGKVYKARKTVKITRTATKTHTAFARTDGGTASRTATATCSRPVQSSAQACAEAAAQAQAAEAARIGANAEASTRAHAQAEQNAATQAARAAAYAATNARVSKAEKQAAQRKATRAAKRALAKMLAKAQKGR